MAGFYDFYDVAVTGGGHAGIEAALAAARMGLKTLLITQTVESIGRMSCNPSIGGIAKGNIVREIDALGGEMARLIDRSMIQFRMLNRSRGPAVQAPRAQADKILYSQLARKTVESTPNLYTLMDTVTDILTTESDVPLPPEPCGSADADSADSADGNAPSAIPPLCEAARSGMRQKITGLVTERGRIIPVRAAVLTTGTFLGGRIFIGEYDAPCGRLGETAATGLTESLHRLGFTTGRLKTGTPPRVLRRTVDFSVLEEQRGDDEVLPFSFSDETVSRPAVPCHIVYTNSETHRIIRENISRSPLYSGRIRGAGPRYCPSVEDKVMRFPERERHQIFVEPESLETEEIYLNGLSSSLPESVQDAFMRTMPGFANAVPSRPGYAVEYDYIEPTQLFPSLETKRVAGLFNAGQINGTSGYEEAAGQGIVAGINAAYYARAHRKQCGPLCAAPSAESGGTRLAAASANCTDNANYAAESGGTRLAAASANCTDNANYAAESGGAAGAPRGGVPADNAAAENRDTRTAADAAGGLFARSAQEAAERSARAARLLNAAEDRAQKAAGFSCFHRIPEWKPLVLGRDEAYTGVLIDDLVTLGTKEPYRMFTARAEYRLKLRHDTADRRLSRYALEAGLITPEAAARTDEKYALLSEIEAKLLKNPGMENPGYPDRAWREAQIEVKYKYYIEKQDRRVEKMRRMENVRIPDDFDYSAIPSLSAESRAKLEKIRPLTLGQAQRISGIRNSDIMLLMVYLK